MYAAGVAVLLAERRHLPFPAQATPRHRPAMQQVGAVEHYAVPVEDAIVKIGHQRHRAGERRQRVEMGVDDETPSALRSCLRQLGDEYSRQH